MMGHCRTFGKKIHTALTRDGREVWVHDDPTPLAEWFAYGGNVHVTTPNRSVESGPVPHPEWRHTTDPGPGVINGIRCIVCGGWGHYSCGIGDNRAARTVQ